ncbi:unnamed protein product [Protopolystoma xenopodis]|uniref:Uncharacterized protein n=1 Tax=Protopolystoma xenopodis TaxID=117903 RepID=A0A3S5A518_9PLAT|nr:unnamed protein product [Protopolystoma xenopodis]
MTPHPLLTELLPSFGTKLLSEPANQADAIQLKMEKSSRPSVVPHLSKLSGSHDYGPSDSGVFRFNRHQHWEVPSSRLSQTHRHLTSGGPFSLLFWIRFQGGEGQSRGSSATVESPDDPLDASSIGLRMNKAIGGTGRQAIVCNSDNSGGLSKKIIF